MVWGNVTYGGSACARSAWFQVPEITLGRNARDTFRDKTTPLLPLLAALNCSPRAFWLESSGQGCAGQGPVATDM